MVLLMMACWIASRDISLSCSKATGPGSASWLRAPSRSDSLCWLGSPGASGSAGSSVAFRLRVWEASG